MFCSECGAGAEGKSCWKCGAALRVGPGADPNGSPPQADWAEQVRYQALIGHPVVRDLVARYGARAKATVSGESVLKVFDKLAGSVVPLEVLGQIAVPLWTRLGVKTRIATRREALARPCGHAIVAALCSLARNGQTLTGVEQSEDGCTLQAEQPSDFRSLQGALVVTLSRQGAATLVQAGAWSRGQFHDWGKSRAALDRLVGDLRDLRVSES